MIAGTIPEPLRGRVLWFGEAPCEIARHAYQTRNLTLDVVAGPVDQDLLASVRGAVFAFPADGSLDLQGDLAANAVTLANQGALVCVSTAVDAQLVAVDSSTKGFNNRWFRISANPAPHEFAERTARHDPGPSAKAGFAPDYAPGCTELSWEDRDLFSRAFASCGKVRLAKLGGGLSGARVFEVLSTTSNSVGSWEQPCFAKVDSIAKIAREADKYKAAARFIPFALRPNVDRVIYGAHRAVLVGNLVDKSESLWDVARRGHADTAINSLFNATLNTWRRFALASTPVPGPVITALAKAGIVARDRLLSQYIEPARDRGAMDPGRMWAILEGLDQSYHYGSIHGDLHAENVRVRGADAVLIDLASAGEGPITADPALLEVWLSFALHKDDLVDRYSEEIWSQTVAALYAPEAFRRIPPPAAADAPLRWLHDAVRQIRVIGCATESCPMEYGVAVAGALLRLCMFGTDKPAELFRRVTAYRIASDIASSLKARVSKHAA